MELKDQLFLLGMSVLLIGSKYLGLNGELFATLAAITGLGAGVALVGARKAG